MKKAMLFFALVGLNSFSLAESYVYGNAGVDAGVDVVLPAVGLGYRSYLSNHGYDISTCIEGLNGSEWEWKARALYLYRPGREGFYSGVGGGIQYSYNEWAKDVFLSVDTVIGYEWQKTFLQLELSSLMGQGLGSFPMPAITIGFRF